MVDNADLFSHFKPVLHSWDILCLVVVLFFFFFFLHSLILFAHILLRIFCVILALVAVDIFLFPLLIGFFWFFICREILDCILCI